MYNACSFIFMSITIASITVHRFFLLVEMSTGIQIISYEVSQPHDSHMMQLTAVIGSTGIDY